MISVIICTYNRPSLVIKLISLLKNQTIVPTEIIVVDSSDIFNKFLADDNDVKYVQSSHKNQPYQRYLGFLSSSNSWLLYLDDDMEPSNLKSVESIIKLKEEKFEYAAFAVGFENLHPDTSLNSLPKSRIYKGFGWFNSLYRYVTAFPVLKDGNTSWNGIRGKLPSGGDTYWFSGGAFLARKDVIFQNFNFGLFSMFEKKQGMGEDFMISFSISKIGKIWSTKEIYFYHNDPKNSTYTIDEFSYNSRVIYSRLFLSLEYARLSNQTKFKAFFYFIYYSFWRFIGLLVNFVIDPKRNRFNSAKGFLFGFLNSFELIFKNFKIEKKYWTNEAKKDLE